MFFYKVLLALAILSKLASATDQFWVTTVITDFKVRQQCSDFWNQSQACPSPLLRVSTDINSPTQFATRAWDINELLNSTEKPSFISQWHGSIESVRVSAQIEGSNPLNPFGLVAKCDQGFHPKVIFNQSSTDVMNRLSTRVIFITSQCFTAKVLVKVDTECPYCPPPTTIAPDTFTANKSFIFSTQHLLIACLILLCLTTFCIIVFFITLRRLRKLRISDPSLKSGMSPIHTNATFISISDEKPIVSKYIDFFSLMPPMIEYDESHLTDSFTVAPMPRLGSLVYDFFRAESSNQLNVSVSDPVFV